ncbi:MAG TPA: hypothetical protein VNG51_15915 [Ktedonobacteraceae bacterium]|nr:hypothetical protein [Ktedonobacteraceae bacterium]
MPTKSQTSYEWIPDFTLDELKPIVSEGAPLGTDYIERYHLPDGRLMVLNGEGKLIGFPKNERATVLARMPTPEECVVITSRYTEAGIPIIMAGFSDEPDYIAGTVLVCLDSEVK